MADLVTKLLKLWLPAFDRRGWQNRFYDNMNVLDAAFGSIVTLAQFRGVWTNSTAYAIGDKAVDPNASTIFQCQNPHTSDASPTTFAQSRLAHPTYWANFSVPANFRGAWAQNTIYSLGDWIVNGNQFAVCIIAHTSSTSFTNDVTAGDWDIVADLTASVNAAAASATASAASAALAQASVGAVKVDVNDTTALPLASKLLAGGLIASSIQNPTGNETYTLNLSESSLVQAQAGTDAATAMTPRRVFDALLSALDTKLGNTNNKFAVRRLGAWSQDTILASDLPTIPISAQTGGNFNATTAFNTLYVVSTAKAICTAPDASSGGVSAGFRFGVKNQSDGLDVTISRQGADTIDGQTSFRVPGRTTVWLIKDSNNSWTVEHRPHHMVGEIVDWATDTLPEGGWAWVNGQTLNRTTYSGLFTVWSTTYGAGDGSTTFGVRDDRGRVKAGEDAMGGVAAAARLGTGATGGVTGSATLGATGGEQSHQLSTPEIPSHSHPVTLPNASGSAFQLDVGAAGATNAGSFLSNTSTTGGGGVHNNIQPTIVTNFVVKT